jgi:hypothetical protein
MIDIATETLISLSDVPPRIPAKRSGKRVHLASVYRWASSGCRGIVLETLQVGGVRCTSVEALQRFFVGLTRAGSGQPATTQTTQRRQREIEAAEKELAGAGG